MLVQPDVTSSLQDCRGIPCIWRSPKREGGKVGVHEFTGRIGYVDHKGFHFHQSCMVRPCIELSHSALFDVASPTRTSIMPVPVTGNRE
jgi:hypothetical protein